VGPSGSGKSSLVSAGLLPTLKHGDLLDCQSCLYLGPIVPGSDPLANLVRALQSVGVEPPPPSSGHRGDDVRERIQTSDSRGLREALGPQPVVLVIDQFEELFTLCDDASIREEFLGILLRLVTAPDARHTVILTMRIDYREKVASFPDFFEQFERGEVL